MKKREGRGKTNVLHRDGLMPAVYYGRTQTATPIAVPFREFQKAWREAGESTVVTLKDEKGSGLDALIYDVDLDPVKNTPRHADFYVFEEGKTIEVDVPLEFVGDSPAIKRKGGILVKVIHHLTVDALPRGIPDNLEVDISTLSDFDSQILAKDIPLPKDVTLKIDPEEVVASVDKPQEEEEEETEEDVDFSAIEVEKKGKEEEDEEASPEENS